MDGFNTPHQCTQSQLKCFSTQTTSGYSGRPPYHTRPSHLWLKANKSFQPPKNPAGLKNPSSLANRLCYVQQFLQRIQCAHLGEARGCTLPEAWLPRSAHRECQASSGACNRGWSAPRPPLISYSACGGGQLKPPRGLWQHFRQCVSCWSVSKKKKKVCFKIGPKWWIYFSKARC